MQKFFDYLNSSSVDGDRILPPRDYPCTEHSKITFFDHRKNLATAIRLFEEAQKTFDEIMAHIKVNSDGNFQMLQPALKEDVRVALHFVVKNLYQAVSWGDPAKKLLATVQETARKMDIQLPKPTQLDESQLYKRRPATTLFENPEKQTYTTRAETAANTAEKIATDGLVSFIVKQFFK